MSDENKAIRALTDRVISHAVANAAPLPEIRDLVEHQIRNSVRVDDQGHINVVDENGIPRISMRPGHPNLTLEEFLDEYKASRPTLFANGRTTTGSGGPQTDPANPFSRSGWNVTSQMTLMKSDPVRAAKLQAEAGR